MSGKVHFVRGSAAILSQVYGQEEVDACGQDIHSAGKGEGLADGGP